MFKLLPLLCLAALLAVARAQEFDEMTHDEVISESKLCGESNFFESDCMEKPNCVFIHWHLHTIDDIVRVCMSYNEIMKYFIKSPTEYLKKLGAMNHKTITKSNFCDVIDDDDKFYDEDGIIKKCTVSTM